MTPAPRPYPGVPVVDGDGHILEPRDLWERELPDRLKDVAIKIVWNEETRKEDEFVQNVNVAPGVGTCNGWARLPRSVRDNPVGLRWEDLTPAGLYPKDRLAELDREEAELRAYLDGGLEEECRQAGCQPGWIR